MPASRQTVAITDTVLRQAMRAAGIRPHCAGRSAAPMTRGLSARRLLAARHAKWRLASLALALLFLAGCARIRPFPAMLVHDIVIDQLTIRGWHR